MKSVEKYLKKKDLKVEYKYAFGQRIPVDHEWRVRQAMLSQRDKIDGKQMPRPEYEIVYDYNGRPTKVKIEPEKEEEENNDSELADIVDEEAYGKNDLGNKLSVKEDQTSLATKEEDQKV